MEEVVKAFSFHVAKVGYETFEFMQKQNLGPKHIICIQPHTNKNFADRKCFVYKK